MYRVMKLDNVDTVVGIVWVHSALPAAPLLHFFEQEECLLEFELNDCIFLF